MASQDIDELPNLNQEESDLAALLVAGPNQEGRAHIMAEVETLLRTIDALRTRLQQAQEELVQQKELIDLGSQAVARLHAEVDVLRAERDAAIERGEVLALLNEQVATEAEKAGLGHLPTPVAVEQLRERAEAAEALVRKAAGKAKEAQALAKQAIPYLQVVVDVCGELQRALAPTEALRAVRAKHRTPPSGEHRSPQSGQALKEVK